jgi:hypothetical protein
LNGCSSDAVSKKNKKEIPVSGEYIYRLHNEKQFVPASPEKTPHESYPWEKILVGNLPKITKEYFRCKGSSINPVRTVMKKGELVHCHDCGGCEKHSLPLKDNKEFIYTILIDLLNYVQKKTGRRVIITSGHRCPDHNMYIDPENVNAHTKHLMGAEVSFYVQGMEEQAEKVIKIMQQYYQENSKYQKQKDFIEFQRYEKPDTDVSIQPWFNKEVFIKLYARKEGRDFDNRHPYSYISLQVRYDMDLNEKVVFTWPKGYNNYFRK